MKILNNKILLQTITILLLSPIITSYPTNNDSLDCCRSSSMVKNAQLQNKWKTFLSVQKRGKVTLVSGVVDLLMVTLPVVNAISHKGQFYLYSNTSQKFICAKDCRNTNHDRPLRGKDVPDQTCLITETSAASKTGHTIYQLCNDKLQIFKNRLIPSSRQEKKLGFVRNDKQKNNCRANLAQFYDHMMMKQSNLIQKVRHSTRRKKILFILQNMINGAKDRESNSCG